MVRLKDEKAWEKAVEVNDDSYGKACVDVAREVMNVLDNGEEFDTHQIICDANGKIDAGGITGFMAGCVAQMVSACHERGEEFRKKWNQDNGIKDEDDKGGVVNPAIITISDKGGE